jgi:AcrR family transcriptional regulator
MTDAELDAALIAAALRLAGEQGWHRVSVAAAARAADIPLPAARGRFPTRHAILLGLGRLADQAVLAEPLGEGSVRDRLFELLMQRLDAFQAHRAGVLAVLRALPTDPAAVVLLTCATRNSMRWMLDAAGVSTTGLAGELRLRGLIGVWLWAVRAWQRDETEDLSATMAALDAALARAEQAATWLNDRRRTPPATPDATAEAEPGSPDDAAPLDDAAPKGTAPAG